MPKSHDIFLSQRRRVLEQLRDREPDLVRELEVIDQAIAALDHKSSSDDATYTPYKSAIQAIVAYLEKRQRTDGPDDIVQAIVAGGWLKGHPNAMKNAKNSIIYHVQRSTITKEIKKFPSGRIGLYSWPNSYDKF